MSLSKLVKDLLEPVGSIVHESGRVMPIYKIDQMLQGRPLEEQVEIRNSYFHANNNENNVVKGSGAIAGTVDLPEDVKRYESRF